ncbi:hypothetical protein [Synoicihabitans lomoniglobus]|uniref:Uncharacterized protein n=1 Tax=Synoicihabitans lomoniglobus TaxID=2909285 RepID=A0AAF0A1C8_9BACT|nr:hypothetical protein [Opitutaceae bacterium LMO-M01]WED65668.1 hypothetical protein PXH66_02255 [Opitutaceae bacterium LMO-M01]
MSRRHKSRHRARTPAPGQPELGLVSIPLLCCLLGAALFVYEYGGSAPTLTKEFLALEEQVAASAFTAHDLDTREQSAAEKLRLLQNAARLARIQAELAQLAARHRDLQQEQLDLDRLEKLLAEIEAARLRIAELEVQRNKVIAERRSLFDNYTGPYVLVECVDNAIIVYPGAQRISLNDLPAHQAALLEQIDEFGYVAIAVRPGGWTRDSFDAAKQLIYAHLDAVRQSTGREIARTDFPIKAAEPIGPYLPRSS